MRLLSLCPRLDHLNNKKKRVQQAPENEKGRNLGESVAFGGMTVIYEFNRGKPCWNKVPSGWACASLLIPLLASFFRVLQWFNVFSLGVFVSRC